MVIACSGKNSPDLPEYKSRSYMPNNLPSPQEFLTVVLESIWANFRLLEKFVGYTKKCRIPYVEPQVVERWPTKMLCPAI